MITCFKKELKKKVKNIILLKNPNFVVSIGKLEEYHDTHEDFVNFMIVEKNDFMNITYCKYNLTNRGVILDLGIVPLPYQHLHHFSTCQRFLPNPHGFIMDRKVCVTRKLL